MSRRTTIVLGVVAAGTVAAAIFVTLAGGSSESAGHKQVSAYIESVNLIQSQMTLEMARVRAAYRNFGKASGGPAATRQLAEADRTLRTLQRRLAALEAPPAGARLRRLLLALVTQEAAVTREVAQLSGYLPGFRAALAQFDRAAATVRRSLAAAAFPAARAVHGTAAQIAAARAAFDTATAQAAAAQATALETYDRSLAAVVLRFRGLTTPPVLRPAVDAQLRAFADMRAAGSDLAAALRRVDRARLPALERRFAVASRSAQALGAQRAEIAAVKAFNHRVRAIATAVTRVQAEITRLQQTLA